jgi:pSer/pThr/pTyr-binding forkhead associated (FHA) protein
VLRDQDRSAPIIRTVHRIGYAFCRAEVALPDDPVVAEHWLSDGERRTVLHEGENMIGRDPAADIWLDLAGVSRKHARIVVRARHAMIEDLGSKNGTTVGSERLMAPRALLDGDSILVGPGRITYRFSESGRSTETAPKHRLAQLLIPPAHTRSED